MDGVTLLVRGRRRKFILDQVRSGARKFEWQPQDRPSARQGGRVDQSGRVLKLVLNIRCE